MKRMISTAVLALVLTGSGSLVRAEEAAAEAQNKRIVLEFNEKVLNGKDPEAGASYFGSHYTQHNPQGADGVEGFRKFMEFLRLIQK